MNIEGFEKAGPFYDHKFFRVGFRRCGEFTIAQADLLENYGKTLLALSKGEKEPTTKEESNFVAFSTGQKPAESPLEHTWAKYQALIKKKNCVNAFGSSYNKAIIDTEIDDDFEDEELEDDDIDEDDQEDDDL